MNLVENGMWEVPVLSAALDVQLPTSRFQQNSHKTFHLQSFEDLMKKICGVAYFS